MKKKIYSVIIVCIVVAVIIAILIINPTYADSSKVADISYLTNQGFAGISLDVNNSKGRVTKANILEFDKSISKITNANHEDIKNSDYVSTGFYLEKGNVEYQVVLYGDANKDGIACDIDDIMVIKNAIKSNTTLDALTFLSANVDNSNDILDINDINRMTDFYTGKLQGSILKVEKDNNENTNEVPNQNIVEPSNTSSEQNTIESKNEVGSNTADESTPVAKHGKLSVNGTKLVDKNGDVFQLKGVSTHGIAWFPQYVNQDAFIYMRDNWGINAVRLAMYSDPNAGYTKELHAKVKEGVEYAKNAGIYVIIDWHVLNDQNPNKYKSNAIEFFNEMTESFKDYDNVLYEICNEPNGGTTWEGDIKPYAKELISTIRGAGADNIILVGTPNWSQYVDEVSKSPIEGEKNIMYTLHFYAATHKDDLRNRAKTALANGLPIFVSEFGACDASGNGSIDKDEANKWIDFLNENNISWFTWSLCNKNESAALIRSDVNKTTGWTNDELSEEGKWFVEAIKR